MRWTTLSRRALLAQRGAVALVALVIAVLALALTALPQLQADAQADQVRHRLADSSPVLRDVTGTLPLRETPGAFLRQEPIADTATNLAEWDALVGALEGVRLAQDLPLRDVLQPPRVVTTTKAFVLPINPDVDVRSPALTLAADPELADHVLVVDGAPPSAPTWAWPEVWPPAPTSDVSVLPDLDLEVMVAQASAERLGLEVGDAVALPNLYVDLHVVVSGIYTPTDPQDPYWQHVTQGAGPSVVEDLNLGTSVGATGFASPDGWWTAISATAEPTTASFFYGLDAAALDGTDPTRLAAQLRGLVAQQQSLTIEVDGTSATIGSVRLASDLPDRMEAVAAENAAAANIVALVVVGPLGVAVAVLALLARLVLERRRPALGTLRARGASPRQLRTTLALEGLLIGLPAAVVGTVVGTLLLGTPSGSTWLTAVVPGLALGLVPALVMAFAPLPTGLRQQRRDLAARGLARDVVVLVLAGLVLAQVLAVEPGAVAGTGDLLLVLAPLVLALAVTVLVLRLYPLLARSVHAALRRGRGVVGFLGSASAVRDPGASLTSVLAVVVSVSVAFFSVVTLTTLRTGVERSVWVSAGADLRVSGPAIDADALAAVQAIDGVAAAASVASISPAILSSPSESVRAQLHLVDAADYAAVLAAVPAGVGAAPVADLPVADDPVPVMVSPRLSVSPGDDGVRISTGEAVPVAPQRSGQVLPGIADASATWVLADAASMPEVADGASARLLLVRLAAGADAEAVAQQVLEITGPAGVENAAAAREQASATPVFRLLETALAGSVVAAALLAIGALAAVQVAAAPRRARVLDRLRMLGLRPAQLRALSWWDLAPWVVLSALVATGLGLATVHLLLGALDLSAFTGSEVVEPVLDPRTLALTTAGVVAVVAACSVVSTIRRAAPPTAEED